MPVIDAEEEAAAWALQYVSHMKKLPCNARDARTMTTGRLGREPVLQKNPLREEERKVLDPNAPRLLDNVDFGSIELRIWASIPELNMKGGVI